jgi:hypothetical protein
MDDVQVKEPNSTKLLYMFYVSSCIRYHSIDHGFKLTATFTTMNIIFTTILI